eukprot:c7688_g1_i3.p1 GENE.c7688_g1_i3~~c7688_g1_i3.p1  ORF type:complete len:361 (+),score=76.02 c7688_g1_i3:50-1132(+)
MDIRKTGNSVTVSWEPKPHKIHLSLRNVRQNRVLRQVLCEPNTNTFTFAFVPPNTEYALTASIISNKIDNSSDTVTDQITMNVTTNASSCVSTPNGLAQRTLPPHIGILMVTPEHSLGKWLNDAPGNYIYTFWSPFNTPESRRFFDRLFELALFILPHQNDPLIPVVHPIDRYCIDLTRPTEWSRSKKVRRHKNEFYLTVSHDFETALRVTAQGHGTTKGTWLTPEFIELLVQMHKDPNAHVRHHSFELRERSTHKLAAVTVGFSLGSAYHDYSTYTIIRDSRSCGNILSKVVGDTLTKCGYTIWYWGIKANYMKEYDECGGVELNRDKFWNVWSAATQVPSPRNIVQFVENGEALIQPK